MSTSIVVPGACARMARMVSAKCCAPPSARSSRSTEVTTICARSNFAVASPTCAGSLASSAPGKSGLDVAEGAGACAGVAHDHEGGVLLLPALADIRAAGLLAHGVQAVLAHDSYALRNSPADTGALTRIQSGFLARGESGRCAFSGWRGRGLLRSRTTAMALTYGCSRCAARRVQACRIARQMAKKTMAPTVAVIRLPRKPYSTAIFSLEKRKPPTMAPTRPMARLCKMPPGPPSTCLASQPAIKPMTIQARTPIGSSHRFRRHLN